MKKIQNQKLEIQKLGLSRLQRKRTSPPCISSDAISQTAFRSQGSEMLLCVGHPRVMGLPPEWVWQPISSETSSYKLHVCLPFCDLPNCGEKTFLSRFSWTQICESSHKATSKLAYFEFIPSTCLFTQEASKAHIWPPGIKISWEVKPCSNPWWHKTWRQRKRNSKRYLCPSVHCSTICLSQDTEST